MDTVIGSPSQMTADACAKHEGTISPTLASLQAEGLESEHRVTGFYMHPFKSGEQVTIAQQ